MNEEENYVHMCILSEILDRISLPVRAAGATVTLYCDARFSRQYSYFASQYRQLSKVQRPTYEESLYTPCIETNILFNGLVVFSINISIRGNTICVKLWYHKSDSISIAYDQHITEYSIYNDDFIDRVTQHVINVCNNHYTKAF